MYYNAEQHLLLDSHVGVSKYDPNTHAFIPVEPISKQEQRLLACMMAHENMLISRGVLLSQVWKGSIISDNSINVSISRLRRKLKYVDVNRTCVKAIRNSGFVFSTRCTGLTPVVSLDFILSSLLWYKNVCSQQ